MNPDPRWLEILKASGWQTAALALACGLILVLVKADVIPTDGKFYWIAVPSIGVIVFGCLSLASILNSIVRAVRPGARLNHWRMLRAEKQSVREYIPYMSDKDREIIGYLLHHNQQVFQATQDGDYAAPLISKGIVRPLGRHGQAIDITRMPFHVPNHIWSVLESNKDAFPYTPPQDGNGEQHPWAKHWMER